MFAFHRHLGAKASLIREDKNCIFGKSESLTVHLTFASAFIYYFLCAEYRDGCSFFKWLLGEEHRIYDTELMR